MVKLDDADKLLEAGIGVDTFGQVMDLVEELEFEETEDLVEDFKRAILLLNELEILPVWLSHWCKIYDVQYNPSDELDAPERILDV